MREPRQPAPASAATVADEDTSTSALPSDPTTVSSVSRSRAPPPRRRGALQGSKPGLREWFPEKLSGRNASSASTASSGPVVNTVTSPLSASHALTRMNHAVLRLTPHSSAHSRSVRRAQKHLAKAAQASAGRWERESTPPVSSVKPRAQPRRSQRCLAAAGDPLAPAARAAPGAAEARALAQERALGLPDLDFV